MRTLTTPADPVKKTPTRRTPQQSSKSGSKAGQSKNQTPVNMTAKINHYCVTCTTPIVGDKTKAMPCDFCNLYTHLACDGKISTELYNAISNCEDNSLIYLCINCRPIMPAKPDELLAGIVGKIETILDQNTKHESLSEKVINRLSDKIVDLDKMCGDHALSLRDKTEELRNMQLEHIRSVSELKNELGSFISDEISKQIQRHIGSLIESLPKPEENQRAAAPNGPQLPLNRDFPPLDNQNPFFGARPRIPQYQSLLNSFQQPGFNPESAFRAPRYVPDHHNEPRPDLTKPNPDKTLVVYNIDRNVHIDRVIEQLHLACRIYSDEITAARRLPTTGNRNPPIIISCISAYIKWQFLKGINELRRTSSEYKDVFARPYLDGEDLRRDRMLVRELNHLRNKYRGRSFKISKNAIHEIVDDELVLFQETETTSGETPNRRRPSLSTNIPPEPLTANGTSTQQDLATQQKQTDNEITTGAEAGSQIQSTPTLSKQLNNG